MAGGATFKGAAKGIEKTYKFGAAKLSGALSKSKTAWRARFGENLSAGCSSSVNTAVKHRTMLAFKEAGILDEKEQLTESAIKSAEKIIPMNKLKNLSLKEKLVELNPNGEWWKYQTKTVNVVGDQKANIHFYKDKKTGQVYLDKDYKIKTDNDLGVGIFNPKPSEKETLESALNKELKEYYEIGKKLNWEQRFRK